jgi:hypothetical protein
MREHTLTRTWAAMLVGFAIPGAGHAVLGRRKLAVAFAAIVLFMFAVGIAVDGGLYTLAESRGNVLRTLASLGSMGSGALYFLARRFGAEGVVTSATFEYGTTFTLTAGLMNLLLVLDCWDIGQGRKK